MAVLFTHVGYGRLVRYNYDRVEWYGGLDRWMAWKIGYGRLSKYIIYMTESWGWKIEQTHGRVAGMEDWTDVMQYIGHGMED